MPFFNFPSIIHQNPIIKVNEKYDPENERKSAQPEKINKIREVLEKAKAERKIEWEETEDEFIIKFINWRRDYSKHNPLKKGQAEKNIKLLEKYWKLRDAKEDEDIYSIKTFERIVHVPKWEEISLPGFQGGKLDIDIMIKVFLENPAAGQEEKISKTAENIKAQEVEKNQEKDNIGE